MDSCSVGSHLGIASFCEYLTGKYGSVYLSLWLCFSLHLAALADHEWLHMATRNWDIGWSFLHCIYLCTWVKRFGLVWFRENGENRNKWEMCCLISLVGKNSVYLIRVISRHLLSKLPCFQFINTIEITRGCIVCLYMWKLKTTQTQLTERKN